MTKIIPGVNFKEGHEYRAIRRQRASQIDRYQPNYICTKGGKSYFECTFRLLKIVRECEGSYGKTYYFSHEPSRKSKVRYGGGCSHIRINLSKKPKWGIISIQEIK